MSRTLFWYIFWDLIKIFMMTSGALAGIMSFGGLLRPLMQGGLDVGQVVKVLSYLSPAMSAYSFPIAALFATTVVYGRMSADNEIVAARAGGISFLAMSVPALVLGLVVSIVSMLFLCFVVPNFTLKVEKVIYSNIAKLIASKFERNHQIKFDNVVVYAQSARVLDRTTIAQIPNAFTATDDEDINPNDDENTKIKEESKEIQRLELTGPMIVNYRASETDKNLKIPTDFYTARRATVYIRQNPYDDRVQVKFTLDEGLRLPRDPVGQAVAGVEAFQFGPIERDSMIKENTKFMVLRDLKRLYASPWKSDRINKSLEQFVSEDQQTKMAELVQRDLTQSATVTFKGTNETYVLSAAAGTTVTNHGRDLVLESPAGGPPTITVTQTKGAPETLTVTCSKLRLRSTPLVDHDSIAIDIRTFDASVMVGNDVSKRAVFPRSVVVSMPPEVKKIEAFRTDPGRYAATGSDGSYNQKTLGRQLLVLKHDIIAELHSRCAFAVSCLALVVVGCTMGMIFKSGNFLTAFAISFVPALACITLIIAGQRTCGNVPAAFWKVGSTLQMGIALIWSGIVVTGALGGAMLWKLHRT